MSLHSKGQNYEKMREFEKALNEFKRGKQLVEATMGTQHELYAVFSSAMGGIKLKTKYNAPADIKREKSKSNSPDSDGKKKKTRKLKDQKAIILKSKKPPMSQKVIKTFQSN